jgi:AraC-like DNA-binding protein
MILQLPANKGFEKVMCLYTILNRLGTEQNCTCLASLTYETPNVSKDPIYQKTIDYIHNHYQSDICLTQIASYAGMNKSALCRYFKRIAGKSIFDYINELRISYTCKLIANTDIRISSIAYDSGFKNISHFNNQFKQIMGYPPSQYKRMFQTSMVAGRSPRSEI